MTRAHSDMPLKLFPPREGKSPYCSIRGTYLGVYVNRSAKAGKRAIALRVLRKIEGEIERGEFAERDEPTFAGAVAAYMKAGGSRRFRRRSSSASPPSSYARSTKSPSTLPRPSSTPTHPPRRATGRSTRPSQRRNSGSNPAVGGRPRARGQHGERSGAISVGPVQPEHESILRLENAKGKDGFAGAASAMANWCNARLIVVGQRSVVLHFSKQARTRKKAGAADLADWERYRPSSIFTPDMLVGEGKELSSERIERWTSEISRKKYLFQIRNDDGRDHFTEISRRFKSLGARHDGQAGGQAAFGASDCWHAQGRCEGHQERQSQCRDGKINPTASAGGHGHQQDGCDRWRRDCHRSADPCEMRPFASAAMA